MSERENSVANAKARSAVREQPPSIGTLNERLAALGLVGVFLLALSALTAPHHGQIAALHRAAGLFQLASARVPAGN